MRVLGLDLEGMNVDIKKGVQVNVDRITEIGAVLWDWDQKAPLEMLSKLVAEPDCPHITEDNTRITGITNEMVAEFGANPSVVADELANLMEKADCIMAHNGGSFIRPTDGYDYQMLMAFYSRYGKVMPNKVWIDTLTDLEFPEEILTHTKGGKSMLVLEHAHGFINPFPHRAVTDVLAMLKIASRYDINRMALLAQSPVVELVWSRPYPGYRASPKEKIAFEEGKEFAKSNGFRWNPDNKEWVLKAKQVLLNEGLRESLGGFDYTIRGGVATADDECAF